MAKSSDRKASSSSSPDEELNESRVTNTANLLSIELNPSQEEELFDTEHRFIFNFGGYRSGKTAGTAFKVLQSLQGDTSQRGALFANTVPQLYNVVLHELFYWLDKAGFKEGSDFVLGRRPPIEWVREWQRFRIPIPAPTIRNYSNLIFRLGRHIVCGSLGGTAYTSFQGLTLEFIIIEELLENVKRVALERMMSRISCGVGPEECKAKHHHALYAKSNPPENPNHWIFGYLRNVVEPSNAKRDAEGKPRLFLYIQSTTFENVQNVGQEFIEAVEDASDEDTARRVLHGEMLQVRTRLAYHRFDHHTHILPTIGYDRRRRIALCFDVNVDPAVAVLGHVLKPDEVPEAYRLDGVPQVAVWGEYYVRGGQDVEWTMRALCEGRDERGKLLPGLHVPDSFRGLNDHLGEVILYGDATSANRSAAAVEAGSPLQIIRSVLRENLGVKFKNRVARSNPSVRMRRHSVNRLFRSASGKVRLFVAPWCVEVIADLDEVTQTPDGDGIEKGNIERTHCMDAVGYWLHADYPADIQKIRQLAGRTTGAEFEIPAF